MLRLILTSLLFVVLAAPSWAQGEDSKTPSETAGEAEPDSDDDLYEDDDDLYAEPDEDDDLYTDPAEDDDLYAEPEDDAKETRETEQASDQTDQKDELDPLAPIEPDVKKSIGIEEIMVTSQRRRSTLQDVPVSVTAFTASEIEAQGIQDIKGISDYTPNLEIKTAFAASNPTLFIRGVGLNDYNANAASSVAVYVDEVYMNSPAGQLFQFFDVQGVEVLRGPQGSLYGRNASAGAIRITSKEPTEDFELTTTATYGRFNEVEVESAIGGGIVDGLVSGRAAVHYRRRDGFVKNHCVFEEGLTNPAGNTFPYEAGWCGFNATDNNDDGVLDAVSNRRLQTIPAGLPARLNDVNNWAARGLLRVTPDFLDMDLLFNVHGGQNLSQTTALFHAGNKEQPPRGSGFYTDSQNYPNQRFFSNHDPWEGHYNRVGNEFLDTLGASARSKMQFGDDATFNMILAYESAKRAVTDDFDASPSALSHNDYNDESWQVSPEVRLDWLPTDNLGLTFGGMYLKSNLEVSNLFRVDGFRNRDYPTLNNPGKKFFQDYDQDTNATGVYGHFNWNFLDDFTLEGGLRYSWESKDFNIQGAVQRPPLECPRAPADDPEGLCAGGNPDGSNNDWLADRPILDSVNQQKSASWSAPTGDLSLSYHLTEDATVYGKYSRGWKPGGFNGSVVTGGEICSADTCPITEPIQAESVDGWEAGIKSYWFDRRLMINAALFFQKYENLQVFVLENTNLTGTPLPKLINANDAEIYGMELEVFARPMVGLDIRSQFGWLESKYLDFTRNFFRQNRSRPPAPPVIREVQSDFTGNRLAANPRFSWSGNASYELSLGETRGYLTPSFSWAFKSLTYFDPTEGKDRGGLAVYRADWQGNTFLGQQAYWLLNARLAYTMASERLEISAWVRNFTNQAYSVDAFSNLEINRSVVRVIGEPRTFGMTLWVSY